MRVEAHKPFFGRPDERLGPFKGVGHQIELLAQMRGVELADENR